MWPIIMIAIAVLLLVGIFLAYPAIKLQRELFKKTGKYPKGHYMGQGMGLGIAIGIPIGVAMGNISFGPAIGVAIGVAIGTSLEKKHEKELRPLTKKEEELKRKNMMIMLGLLLLGMVVFTVTYFLAR